MTLFIAVLSALGGMAIGYSVKHLQDSFYLSEIKSTYDELEEMLKRENKHQRATISRLNSIIIQHIVDNRREPDYVDIVYPNEEV